MLIMSNSAFRYNTETSSYYRLTIIKKMYEHVFTYTYIFLNDCKYSANPVLQMITLYRYNHLIERMINTINKITK